MLGVVGDNRLLNFVNMLKQKINGDGGY